ncbi:unnamed protein product, partial [Staurois parvus]
MMSGNDILFTTVHVITDWPISDHMIGTSHRGPVQRSVFRSVRRERAQAVNAGAMYVRKPAPALLPSSCLCTWTGRGVVKV